MKRFGGGEHALARICVRRAIRERDIFWWVDSFLRAGTARDLDDFTVLEEVMPTY